MRAVHPSALRALTLTPPAEQASGSPRSGPRSRRRAVRRRRAQRAGRRRRCRRGRRGRWGWLPARVSPPVQPARPSPTMSAMSAQLSVRAGASKRGMRGGFGGLVCRAESTGSSRRRDAWRRRCNRGAATTAATSCGRGARPLGDGAASCETSSWRLLSLWFRRHRPYRDGEGAATFTSLDQQPLGHSPDSESEDLLSA